MIMLVIIKVKIGTPTFLFHFQSGSENSPEITSGSPKSALITTIRIPMLMKSARNNLSMIEEFIAVKLLYRSNLDILLKRSLIVELMKLMTIETPITAIYLAIEFQNIPEHKRQLSEDVGMFDTPRDEQ